MSKSSRVDFGGVMFWALFFSTRIQWGVFENPKKISHATAGAHWWRKTTLAFAWWRPASLFGNYAKLAECQCTFTWPQWIFIFRATSNGILYKNCWCRPSSPSLICGCIDIDGNFNLTKFMEISSIHWKCASVQKASICYCTS